jgi:hypothetical protein
METLVQVLIPQTHPQSRLMITLQEDIHMGECSGHGGNALCQGTLLPDHALLEGSNSAGDSGDSIRCGGRCHSGRGGGSLRMETFVQL